MTKDRDLLRRAGEHLGSLAEAAHERAELTYTERLRRVHGEHAARLRKLSGDILKEAEA